MKRDAPEATTPRSRIDAHPTYCNPTVRLGLLELLLYAGPVGRLRKVVDALAAEHAAIVPCVREAIVCAAREEHDEGRYQTDHGHRCTTVTMPLATVIKLAA
jgi:hypothetical protein